MIDTESERSFLRFLDAALYWRGVHSSANDLEQKIQSLRVPYELGQEYIPLVLALDLSEFLEFGPRVAFSSSTELSLWPKDERAFRMAYEDRILNTWANDPSLNQAHVIIAGDAAHDASGELGVNAFRQKRMGHALSLALNCVNQKQFALHPPAHFRKAAVRKRAYLAFGERSVDDDSKNALRRTLELCMDCFGDHPLFSKEDLWELSSLAEIKSESQRMALRQLHVLSGGFPQLDPQRVRAFRQARKPPHQKEDGNAPRGGLSALATKGHLENLARTELMFLDEDSGIGVDLFDVRFVENELLFYTRDQSPPTGQLVHYQIEIDKPADLQCKTRIEDAQALVTALALVRVLHRAAQRVFGPQSVRGTLHFRCHDGADDDAAAESIALLRQSLRAEFAHERFTATTLPHGAPKTKANTFASLLITSRSKGSDRARHILRYQSPDWRFDECTFLNALSKEADTKKSTQDADLLNLETLFAPLFEALFLAHKSA